MAKPNMDTVLECCTKIYETMKPGEELEWAMALIRLATASIQSQAQYNIEDDQVQQTSVLTATGDGVAMLQVVDDVFAITEYAALCGVAEAGEGDMMSVAIDREDYYTALQTMANVDLTSSVDNESDVEDNTTVH